MPDSTLEAMAASRAERMKQRRQTLSQPEEGCCTFVVEVEEDGAWTIVGFATGGPARGQPEGAELYALYVQATHQGAGHGRALLRTVAEWLAQRDHRELAVWVLDDNPASQFYASLGGHPRTRDTHAFGDTTLPKTMYGWTLPFAHGDEGK